MKTAVSIVTCPRLVSYVEETARALAREGANGCSDRFVIVDGQRAPELPGWDVHYSASEKPQGLRVAMWRAFRLALERGADQLIFCEDDVLPVRNAVTRMANYLVPPSVAFVDFHDKSMPFARGPGVYAIQPHGLSGDGYNGTQCMLFPRRTLEFLARIDPSTVGGTLPNGDRLSAASCNHADTVLGFCIARSLWPRYLAHLPRLVRHVGKVSAAYAADRNELEPTYVADDFDALAG